MALINDYELHGTGVVVANAYHVITTITTEKRVADIPPPPDPRRPDGKTPRDDSDESKHVFWKAGYVGRISITVWKDKAAKDAGAAPIGFIGVASAENTHKAQIATPGKSHECYFMINVNSPKSEFEQGYEFLKTKTDYYKNAKDG